MITTHYVYMVVRQAIRDIINDDCFEVILAKQNSPEPSDPYCTVFVHQFNSISGWSKTQVADELDIEFTDREKQEVMVSVKMFNHKLMPSLDDRYEMYANKVKLGMRRPAITQLLNKNGLSLTRTSGVRDLTAVIGEGFDYRNQLDIFINFVQSDVYSVERILSVEADGVIETPTTIEEVSFDTRLIN